MGWVFCFNKVVFMVANLLKNSLFINLSHKINPDIPYFHAFEPIQEKNLF